MAGYKAAVRDRIALGVGEQLTVPFTLEVGQVTEEIVVTAETPLLDTTSLKSAARFDTHLVESLPMFSNMPITLARFAPGTNVNDQQTQVRRDSIVGETLGVNTVLQRRLSTHNGQVQATRDQHAVRPRDGSSALNQMRFFTFGLRATF